MEMRGIKLRKVRTLLFSIFSFSCFFVLLLNLMVVQLNSPENATKLNLNPGSLQRKLSQHQKLVVEDLDNSEEFKKHYQNTKVIERKPQGMKEENVPHKSNKVFYNPVQYITEKQKHNIEMDYKISQLKKLVKKKRQDFIYDYEPDINKAYIEDEDEDDEDDYDYPNSKEMDNYNKELILNNFNETKLNFLKPKLKFHEVPLVKPVELVTKSVLPITKKTHVIRNVVEDGIYWSNEVEQLIPKGFDDDQLANWTNNIRQQPIKSLKLPTWNKCGRAKNRYVILGDGTSLCGRYRHPHNKLVLGEVLSFYLSKLLKMDNVPGVVLSKLDSSTPQWSSQNLHEAGWEEGKFVAFIQWIPDMETRKSYVHMPKQILEALESNSLVSAVSLADDHLSPPVLSDLVQWGTMIIFDYLTANYDRVGSMQDGAFREKNPGILKENIRNLRVSLQKQKLWLIDNESGLLDAYDLLYKGGENGKQFITFHQQMLQTMCIFQRSVVQALQKLHKTIEPHKTLEDFARQQEPFVDQIPKDDSFDIFKMMFSKRLNDVFEWIQYCQNR